VRNWKPKLVLFFTLQTLAVGTMIKIGGANQRASCMLDESDPTSPFAVLAAIALVFGELGVVVLFLRSNLRVWRALVSVGLVFLVVVVISAPKKWDDERYIASALGAWHALAAAILGVSGVLAGIWDLLERMRRPDTSRRDDDTSAMWPFD
jgi:hypothetical protein